MCMATWSTQTSSQRTHPWPGPVAGGGRNATLFNIIIAAADQADSRREGTHVQEDSDRPDLRGGRARDRRTVASAQGVGAKLVWSGNDKVGSGSQLITAAIPDRSVASDLDFGRMGIAKSSVLLVPDGSMTRTTWTLDIDMGASPIGHYFGLMMDRMVGKDYETGMPKAEIGGFDAEPVQLTA
jgi:hypothetical protein